MNPKPSFSQKIILVSFGILCCIVILEISLRLVGLVFSSLQQYRNNIAIRQKGAYRIMCLGESTTADQYPSFLEKALNQRNIGIKFTVIDKGIRGTTTSYIVDSLKSNLEAYRPDMVITMMGVADEGSRMLHEAVSDSKLINFLKSFRTYKLTRIIWLHIVTGLKELKHEKLAGYILRSSTEESQLVYAQKNSGHPESQDDTTYFELAWVRHGQGKLSEAEALFKKAIELEPKNYEAYIKLGEVYQCQGKFSEAEALFKKAIELEPKKNKAYFNLGWVHLSQIKFLEAEAPFKKVIELEPENEWAYVALGVVYYCQVKLSEAEKSLKKAIELEPKNGIAYARLGVVYLRQGKLSEAEASFKKAIELTPKNYKAYGALKALYIEIGNSNLAKEYDRKAEELGLNNYAPLVIDNYHRLKGTLDKKGITYVCVQYPMRNVEPLKKIFQDNTEGIVFVDNERIFKDAVKQENYMAYFKDMVGGDFGHCTDKGNRLLAENIANVILKEVFHK